MSYFDDPKNVLVSLALADHLGDVADCIPALAKLFNLPEPEWSDRYERFVFAWEEPDDDEEDDDDQ